MPLSISEIEQFLRLHRTLLVYVNQRLRVIPEQPTSADALAQLPSQIRVKVRDALLANVDLIESFAAENPYHLPEEELDIVRSWRHMVAGEFYVFRELKQYTAFLSSTSPTIVYGVLPLYQPITVLIGPRLPVLTRTVLLPFKNRIVFDSLMNSYSILFGPGIRRSMNESFKAAKARDGIVTSLPQSTEPLPPKAPKAKPAPKPPKKVAKDESFSVIIGLIDQFCQEHLNEEYAVLCRRLAEKLARKRPSPLASGKPNTWASAIVRTIGWANFLDDRTQTPHMKLTAIDKAFGISESTGQGKSMLIRKTLRIQPLDPSWTLPSRLDDNPMVWLLQVNGIMLDIREAPRTLQEMAFNKGLIPYIPADREE